MSKHLLLYTDDPGLGGVAQYNYAILSGLVALGYQVTCVQSKSDNPLVSSQKELGIQHIWLNFDTGREFGRTLTEQADAQNILTTYKPDFIIFSDCCPLSNFAAKQIAIDLEIPYIVVIGFVAPYLAERFTAYLNELSHQYSQAQAVIAVSNENRSLLHKLFRLPNNKGQVVYYGRSKQYFTPPVLSVRECLRQEFDIPPNAVVCFTAARLEAVKGYQYQLEAIKQLKQSETWDKLYFVWAGAGNLEAQLKEAIEQLGVSSQVKLLGQRWDIQDWLDASDIFILPSELEGMPLCIMEAMAKGLPVIASAVSGIPEELGNTGKLLTDPKVEPQTTITELVTTIQAWFVNSELRQSIGQTCKKRAEGMFKEERMVKETVEVIERALLPVGDYVSPEFSIVLPDKCFPNMIVGDTSTCPWPYLRREVPHNWYVDKRQPTVGFLSRDEAHILYNTALKFKGKKALEIGCWLGWSACHLALAGVELDIVDPLLGRTEFYKSISSSLRASGVLGSVNLIAGFSPQKVEEIASQLQRRWSLIFIDGNHDAPSPLNDAIACEQLAESDALILFHDLASPDVAQGLDYLKQRGWNTMVYQTMQVMGVAWRGNVEPTIHQPDPKVNWELPKHLQHYPVSGRPKDLSEAELQDIFNALQPYTLLSEARLFSLYSLAKQVCLNDIPGNFVECGTYKGGSAALLAFVIQRYSLRPRLLYAFDTFEGMPDPTEVDRYNGIPANITDFGVGTLKAPISENLDKICQLLKVRELVIPVQGLFAQTLPQYEPEIGSIAFLHADGDWYKSTMDIFNTLYDSVVSDGIIQVDDYGHWEGCKKAIHDFEGLRGKSFALHEIDYIGVWFQKNELTKAQQTQRLVENYIIPPEIKNDDFFYAIQKLAREENIKTVLEIGSSTGEGSTEAFVTGIRENPNKPTLFCIEALTPRFAELQKRYANDFFVKCYNSSSVALEEFPNENELVEFYNNHQTSLNHYPLDTILGWLRQNIEYVANSGVTQSGIKKIKQENQVDFFDLVLIDGSEFTGNVELDEVYGARFILLDDIKTFKNYKNYRKLLADSNYTLVTQNFFLRNGYAIFKKTNNSIIHPSPALPIHFFTIVLNGEPFIRYHIDVFKQLPFQWHWHIIEGVADLKHDTAWSLRNGGCIADEVHRNGCSNDGTTEYLDELARLYPKNVTVYRKPKGVFWDGKCEMVNAPLANINEECLLWQVDADELWTVEHILTARKMFINDPEKTAAFYWCWYFVGKYLIISTRNCYAQNPQQEWVRTWRYKPGSVWVAHEPPKLAEPLLNGQWRDIASVNPFTHEETENLGLIFQHFAYVTLKQLQFKEQYYGYKNAVSQWQKLQAQTRFPVLLREYFSWVKDTTQVNKVSSCGIVPIAQSEGKSDVWRFLQLEELHGQPVKIENSSLTIIVDGVFFQLYKTGIARVWESLLEEWVNNGFAKHILILDRARTAPKIFGIRYRSVPAYDYSRTDADREMLQQVCDEEGADLFISSYYTTPLSTPSVFLAHDMIPELMGANLNHPMWREKHYGIQHASAYIAVSENTARDLVKFFPSIFLESIKVAQNGVNHQIFSPASPEKITWFKTKYGISRPYFLLVGAGDGYKNSILFFKAFAQLYSKQGFDIICTGSGFVSDTDFRAYTSGSTVHTLQLSDEELSMAYSGAVALVYPSKYEGFGLPVLEAIACGCPVITCPNASIPEVAGEAALYVHDEDLDGLANVLCEVQKPLVRNSLIAAGLKQAKKFSWSKMAETVSSALIDTTLLPLNLRDINLIIFPDWSQPEEVLCSEIEQVIRVIATHPDSSQMTLLVENENISDEEAALIFSSVSMNLLMQEDLDVSEGGLEISFVGQLGEIQWEALLPRIKTRIVLENENKEAIAQVKAENITSCELNKYC